MILKSQISSGKLFTKLFVMALKVSLMVTTIFHCPICVIWCNNWTILWKKPEAEPHLQSDSAANVFKSDRDNYKLKFEGVEIPGIAKWNFGIFIHALHCRYEGHLNNEGTDPLDYQVICGKSKEDIKASDPGETTHHLANEEERASLRKGYVLTKIVSISW